MRNFFTHIRKVSRNKGMTYVELIVVLSIFSIITSVSLFNYQKFEEKVNVKSLANDIALKIVEAQKSSTSGTRTFSKTPLDPVNWKPSYGIVFNPSQMAQAFLYFIDLDQSKLMNGSIACTGSTNRECLQRITIPASSKSATIKNLDAYYVNPNDAPTALSDVHITYTRPDSVATFSSTGSTFTSAVEYIQITLATTQGSTARIKVYASGRIQIN